MTAGVPSRTCSISSRETPCLPHFGQWPSSQTNPATLILLLYTFVFTFKYQHPARETAGLVLPLALARREYPTHYPRRLRRRASAHFRLQPRSSCASMGTRLRNMPVACSGSMRRPRFRRPISGSAPAPRSATAGDRAWTAARCARWPPRGGGLRVYDRPGRAAQPPVS